jgi:hypothetical protein
VKLCISAPNLAIFQVFSWPTCKEEFPTLAFGSVQVEILRRIEPSLESGSAAFLSKGEHFGQGMKVMSITFIVWLKPL